MAINYEIAKPIWQTLICFYPNPYGTAALMGNLFAESSLNPECITGGGLKTKAQKQAYIQDVNDGKISLEQFSKDGIAVGIVQWRYWSRKESFLTYCREYHGAISETGKHVRKNT